MSSPQPTIVITHCVQVVNWLAAAGYFELPTVLRLDEHALLTSLGGVATHGLRVDEVGVHVEHLREHHIRLVLLLAQ